MGQRSIGGTFPAPPAFINPTGSVMDSNQRGTTGYADRPTPPTPSTPPPDVGQVVDQAKQTGKQVVDQVQEQAFSRLGDQIDHARESVGAVAEATRSVGQQLRRSDQGFVADYVDQAAGQIERFAGYLENKSVDELMYDAERFARRQPAMFLGGAFVLGVL